MATTLALRKFEKRGEMYRLNSVGRGGEGRVFLDSRFHLPLGLLFLLPSLHGHTHHTSFFDEDGLLRRWLGIGGARVSMCKGARKRVK